MATPEGLFQKRVLRRLKQIEGMYVFKKEAAAIRGIPDVIGCFRGRFFCLELKASSKLARRTTGRIVLQKHNIERVRAAGGYGAIVYPENFEEVINQLLSFS